MPIFVVIIKKEDATVEIYYRSDERLTAKAAADLMCVSLRTAYRRICALRLMLGKPSPQMLTVGELSKAYGIESPKIVWRQESCDNEFVRKIRQREIEKSIPINIEEL